MSRLQVRVASRLALVLLVACGNPAPPVAAPTEPQPPAAAPALPPTRLAVAGFSATREALQTRLLPAFAERWQRTHRTRLAIDSRFLGSEALVDGLCSDLTADVVVLASTRELDTLVAAGRAAPDWRQPPHQGIVCRSLVVLAVRAGNPKGIHNWADLARPGVRVVGCDPTTSGCGVWAVCAIYGAALRGHAGVPAADPAAARDFVGRIRANVVANGSSAHDAFLQFLDGHGDVAVTYESELGYAWMFGHDVARVVPTSTVLVESPAVRIRRAGEDRHPAADALLAFLWSPEAQQVLANCGLRPVDANVAATRAAQFPQPQDLWTIDDLGGWERFSRDVLPGLAGAAAPGK